MSSSGNLEKASDKAQIAGAEEVANKNVANGYMGTDANNRGSRPPKTHDHSAAGDQGGTLTKASLSDAAANSGVATLDSSGHGAQPPKLHSLKGQYHTDHFLPDVAIAQTYSRDRSTGNMAYLLTGRETATRIVIPPTQVINGIAFFCASTALTAGTHQYAVLRDSTYNKLALSFDDVANAWGGSVRKLFYLSRVVTDATITSGQAVVNSSTGSFTDSDIGKQVIFVGAGAAGATLGAAPTLDASSVVNTNPSVTIASRQSGTQVTLSANAGTTVASGGTFYIATPYTTINSDDAAFYVSLMVSATTTVPTIAGIIPTVTMINMMTPLPMTVDVTHTGLTTPATAPTQLTAGLSGALGMGMAYAYVF